MAADQRLVKAIMSGRGKGANLEDADLEGARLQGVDFSRANLDGANLRNAYLLGANLKGVHAMYADFYDAILADADLTGANLQDADFRNANLYGAKLAGANIYDAKLQGADLTGVTYDARTIWPRGFTPPGEARMASRDSRGRTAADKRLVEMIMRGDATGEDLSRANLERANLQNADLHDANLTGAKLKGANLSFANLNYADLTNADLRGVRFMRTNLQAAALYGADLTGTDMTGVNLKGIEYDAKTKWPEGFTPPGRISIASLGNSTAVPAIGDILVSSWGYDQTNVDFYEVVGISGSMIMIQEIGKRVVGQESGSEKVMPVPGRYTGKPMRKKPSPSYSGKYGVKISTYASASLWNGMPQYQTAAGYGH